MPPDLLCQIEGHEIHRDKGASCTPVVSRSFEHVTMRFGSVPPPILRENTLGVGQELPASLPLPQSSREALRLNEYLVPHAAYGTILPPSLLFGFERKRLRPETGQEFNLKEMENKLYCGVAHLRNTFLKQNGSSLGATKDLPFSLIINLSLLKFGKRGDSKGVVLVIRFWFKTTRSIDENNCVASESDVKKQSKAE
ncbi:hypothetical protein TNCV_2857971 [Trichonephila clavipes]|nr:hypothetical protein TNCV_2857971 [Trichonephila clavipes]